MQAKLIGVVIALLAILGVIGVLLINEQKALAPEEQPVAVDPTTVQSFEDCVAAGYPVAESYPRQCRTPDGRTYAEELPAPEPTYDNASADMIRVENPTPGAVVGKSFVVTGEARGGWYFEASFPVEVRDPNGNILAQGPAQAEGEWMTTNFVPFSAPLTIPASYIGPATLILRNDNPSGLPENAASVSFPITIEY